MRSFVAVLAAVFCLAQACDTPGVLSPAVGPNTEYPCGIHGVSCTGHMCCWEGDTCGGDDHTCPTGMCCFVGGDSMVGAKPTQRMHSQEAEQ